MTVKDGATRRKIRTLIVDDEPLAREGIRRLLACDPDFELAGECGDGVEASAMIRKIRPDLIFLDVQMPEVDGFGVVSSLDPSEIPLVVFVTAHDRYAIEAFRVAAVDYLLKPVDPDRFSETLGRIRTRLLEAGAGDLRAAVAELARAFPVRPAPGRITVRSSDRIVILNPDEIRWIEASGDYITLHTAGERHLLRETMASILDRLDPARFVRIHRSTIVNIGAVKELRPLFRGEYALFLTDGTRLVVSRTCRKQLGKLLDRPL